MPTRQLMLDSLADQAPGAVRTNTRFNASDGSACPLGADRFWAVDRKGVGRIGCPATGSMVGYLSLKASVSNVFPAVAEGPAIMNASSLAKARNPPPL